MFSRNFLHIHLPKFGRFAQHKFLLSILLVSFICILLIQFLVNGYFLNLFYHPNHRYTFNYSVEVEKYSRMRGYLVETPTCNILNISAWDESILPFLKTKHKTVNCHNEKRQWTYTEESKLIINVTSMEETGHSLSSVACCYMKITRIDDSHEDYDFYSDRKISFSKDCTPCIKNVTQLIDIEFIRVYCQGKYWPIKSDILYRNFHALVPLYSANSFVKNKIDYWKRRRQGNKNFNKTTNSDFNSKTSPNFIILGIDSMSRLSFQRNMQNTIKVLEEIGAIEMLGYTKVGENSFPNAAAFLSGYTENVLKNICYFSRKTFQDECPYIWKRFSSANYMTAFIEDVPLLATFNYIKTGFVKQPVDYYFRPFMLGVHGHSPVMSYTLNCIGHKTVDETLLQYIHELHRMSRNENTPLFLYAWLTNLAHEDLNISPYFDNIYSNYIKSLDLSNTVFILMSDHGYRFGEIRQTFAGWYEDKLPAFWIYLPLSLVEQFPEWKDSLVTNSKYLTSPFDLYQTMSHFLDTFTEASKEKVNYSTFRREYGQSLFTKLPVMRTCQDIGVSHEFCACVPNIIQTQNANILSTNYTIVY